eukprot:XP_001709949.1 Hypothetical protein GL50803_29575 [Giardia lamblia ATCC 50803]
MEIVSHTGPRITSPEKGSSVPAAEIHSSSSRELPREVFFASRLR